MSQKTIQDLIPDATVDLSLVENSTALAAMNRILSRAGNGGSGSGNYLSGNSKSNELEGRGNNDVLLGMAGDDELRGQGGDDVLDGGTGDDQLSGDGGDDHLIYRMSEDYTGAQDQYDGGGNNSKKGDTLWLVLTQGEYKAYQGEIEAAQRSLAKTTSNQQKEEEGSKAEFKLFATPLSPPTSNDTSEKHDEKSSKQNEHKEDDHHSQTFSLSVKNVERIEVVLTNRGPTAVGDTSATSENSPVTTGNLLLNDTDPDHLDELSVASFSATSAMGAALTSVGNGALRYDPGTQFDDLAVGQTAVDSFTYTIRDLAGSLSTAAVNVTVTGTNDAPVAVADRVAGTENQTLTIDVLANDTDVDNGHVFALGSVSAPAGKGTVSMTGNKVVFSPGTAFDQLAQGAAEHVTVAYAMQDEFGASSSSSVDITITGVNDTPVAVADTAAGTENQTLTIDVLANDTDVDNGHVFTLGSASAPAGQGTASAVDNKLVFNPGSAFDQLAQGAVEHVTVAYAMQDEFGASSTSSVDITITGVNDAPKVGPALSSVTNEDATPYTIDLLAWASDVDLEAVLHAGTVTEANGNGGWSVVGNTITITPNFYNAMNTGDFTNLAFSYQVIDDQGASVNQTLTLNIAGITDAPSLAITTSSGAQVNEIRLAIESHPANGERVELSFTGLPQGAIIQDSHAANVTSGVANFNGTETFTVVLAGGTDVHKDITVTATGRGAANEDLGHTAQAVGLSYDFATANDNLSFGSSGQNMWGDFPGMIGWHEYIPIIGGAPIVWNETTGKWDDVVATSTDTPYWRSGDFNVANVSIDSAKVLDLVSKEATKVLVTAKAVFDVASVAVDTVAKGVFDTAKGVLQAAENTYYNVAHTVDAAAQNAFQAARDVYAGARDLYNKADYAFHTVARDVYNAAVALDFLGWFRGPINDAYSLAESLWNGAKNAFEVTATGIYNAAVETYNAAAGAVDAAAHQAFNDAHSVFATAENVYNGVKKGIYDAAKTVYDTAQNGILAVLQDVNSKVQFDSKLKIDSEVFAQVGLQVDFVLDMGSVTSSVDYQLTSTTQYNQTTDALAITPTMMNKTTGSSVAFSTISPNAKFYAAILYDVGADFNVFADGKLVVNNQTLYDLSHLVPNSPNSNGISVQVPISTQSFESVLSTLSGGNVDVGKLVIVDLDSTKTTPYEVPFLTSLTQDAVTLEFAIPTIKTDGTADTYTDQTFKEGGLINVDFSELSGAFFNMLNAKFDFSPEFKAKYGLASLGDQTLAETVNKLATGLMGDMWALLKGKSNGIPIFVLDTTDQTSTSLFHVNWIPDSVITNTTGAHTGSLGFYAAYGENDQPVVKFTLDVDAAYVAIIKLIAKAVAAGLTSGASTTANGLIDALPSPYNIELGLDTILKMASIPPDVAKPITDWIDVNFSFEPVDLDVSAQANFSQEFTLSVDDMTYLVTFEDGKTSTFTANGDGKLLIENASSHDANHDGSVGYSLNIVPTAMFSNNTDIGLNLAYQLDFLKGGFEAGVKLPLNTLLGIQNADWLNLSIPAIDISMGPLLRVTGDLDALTVDIFESRFPLNVGSDSYAGAVDIALVGTTTPAPSIA